MDNYSTYLEDVQIACVSMLMSFGSSRSLCVLTAHCLKAYFFAQADSFWKRKASQTVATTSPLTVLLTTQPTNLTALIITNVILAGPHEADRGQHQVLTARE